MKPYVVLIAVFLLWASTSWANDGVYVGMDVGVAIAPDLDLDTGGYSDWAAGANSYLRCDRTINPEGHQITPGDCSDEPRRWGPLSDTFDGTTGILAGVSLGYRWHNFRVEREYLYRNTNYQATALPTSATYTPAFIGALAL